MMLNYETLFQTKSEKANGSKVQSKIQSQYKVEQLQIDRQHTMFLKHDDQAGFRLDSTFTHKSIRSLNKDGPTLTTHTDFLNKHQTHTTPDNQLQFP